MAIARAVKKMPSAAGFQRVVHQTPRAAGFPRVAPRVLRVTVDCVEVQVATCPDSVGTTCLRSYYPLLLS